jgi:tetratricopeptide (TPR) repeat protein
LADKFKYKAFISYSHADEKWAAWLHKALETYRVPRHLVGQDTAYGPVPDRIAPIFRDREELSTATSLGDTLTEALRGSACQIVICSPRAARSRWTNEEILTFKRLGRSDRIYCLIVDGEPNASDDPENADQECFPPALRYELGDDLKLGNTRTEPIAADARPGKDSRLSVKLKLISGMLGVGYDALRQRDAQRRHRRMMLLTAAAVTGMAITTGLAITAYFARIEAEAQRNQAQIDAERARQVTDFMVGLFRLSDPSEARGNTITVREVLDTGAARIDAELAGQPEVRATLMDTMGTVYQSLALYPEAGALLDKALATRRERFGPRHQDVAQSMAHLAEVLSLQAEYAAAEPMYREALETQRSLLGVDSPQVAATLLGLADMLTMDGRFAEAEPLLRESLSIRRRSGDSYTLEIAETLEYLGMNQYDQGIYDEAEKLLREAVAMQRRLVTEGLHPDLADSISNLALVLSGSNRDDEVEVLYREALAMNQRLQLDDAHPTIAANLNNLAFVLHDKKEYDEAEEMFRAVIDMRRKRLGEEHPEVALAMNNLAFLLYDKGDRAEAMAMATDSLAMFEHLFPEGHPNVATSLTNLARWQIDSGELESAEPMLERSIAMQEEMLGADHPRTAVTRTELARVRYYSGRYDEAAAAAAAARASLAASLSPDNWRTAWAGVIEGAALSRKKEFAAAERLLVDGYEIMKADPGTAASSLEQTGAFLAELYTSWGKPAQASEYTARAGEP